MKYKEYDLVVHKNYGHGFVAMCGINSCYISFYPSGAFVMCKYDELAPPISWRLLATQGKKIEAVRSYLYEKMGRDWIHASLSDITEAGLDVDNERIIALSRQKDLDHEMR